MKEQASPDNWQLQEDGPPDERWILRPSEQNVTDQWDLQAGFEPEDRDWKPVEYVKPNRPAIAWVLPTIITVALLGVLGYTAYRLLPLPFGAGTEEPQPASVALAPTEQAAQETPAEPSVTGEAVTPPAAAQTTPVAPAEGTQPVEAQPPASAEAPSPTPLSLETRDFAVVTSPYGLNVRSAPNPDSQVIRVLEQGETLFVLDNLGQWVELFVTDAPLAEGQPLSGTVGFAAAEYLEISTREISLQLVKDILGFLGRPTPTPEGGAPAEEAPAAETPAAAAPVEGAPGLVLPTPTPAAGQAPAAEAPEAAPEAAAVRVTVDAVNGVNVRRDPTAAGENVIRLLENGTILTAVARSSDGAWIQVLLPDGLTGWITADFIQVEGELQSLPLPDAGEPAVPAAPPVDAGEVVTSGVVPGAPYTNIVPAGNTPAVIVNVPDGVNARSAPNLDAEAVVVVPEGAVLVALARSPDSQWVLVELPTGEQAWIFRDTVTATPAVGALPAQAVETPTPTPEPVVPAAPATPEPEAAEPTAEASVTASVRQLVLPVYAEPQSGATRIDQSGRGSALTVLGRNTAGDWIQVETAGGEVGWVAANGVTLSADVATLPVVQ